MQLTLNQLIACGAGRQAAAKYLNSLNKFMPAYGIDQPIEVAHFLAQILHESIGLTATVENLNYSAVALLKTWPKRFSASKAAVYARKPEAIGNYVYANRNGNGSELSGDGWKYRGRGPIQATGRVNYLAFAKHTGVDYTGHPELLERPDDGIRFACWYWSSRNLSTVATKTKPGEPDFALVQITEAINGGLNGFDDRRRLLFKAKTTLLAATGVAV